MNEVFDSVDEVIHLVNEVPDSVDEVIYLVSLTPERALVTREHDLASEQAAPALVSSADMKTSHRPESSLRVRGILLGALVGLLLAGCRDNLRSTTNGAPSNVPSHPQAAAAADIVARDAEAPSAPLDGTWMSPSCGARAYARFITFEAGRFTAEDRVAPCPPGAQCIWSGVVYRAGTYSINGQTLLLDTERADASNPGAPFPKQLILDPDPLEQALSDGGEPIRCAYSRR